MAVKVVCVFIAAVAHKLFADVLDHARLNESGVKSGTQVLEAERADSGPTDCSFPGRFDPVNGPSFISEDQPIRQRLLCKEVKDPLGHGYFAGLATGGFGAGHDDYAPG